MHSEKTIKTEEIMIHNLKLFRYEMLDKWNKIYSSLFLWIKNLPLSSLIFDFKFEENFQDYFVTFILIFGTIADLIFFNKSMVY
jgi:hypothetical protein